MPDRPIIFSAPMVRALLREVEAPGTGKTQTRRVLSRLRRFGPITEFQQSDTHGYVWTFRDRRMLWHDLLDHELREALPYAPGDQLWVRETCSGTVTHDEFSAVRYDADQVWRVIDNTADAAERWLALFHYRGKRGATVPPIHMPRWASRLTLTVTEVRAERVQDISASDTIAEGVQCPTCEATGRNACKGLGCFASRQAFRDLWDSIHGPGAWKRNDWVAAYTFTVEQRNIDHA